VKRHPEVIFCVLFHSAWQTLKHFGENPKRLSGQLGMSALLHTWGQTLIQTVIALVLFQYGVGLNKCTTFLSNKL
jgi:hypothetical protein